VSEAVDGEQAVQMAMEMPYDVIPIDIQMPVLNGPVLDINMPVLDGLSVLEALKAGGCLFPVLVLTARHARDDVRRAVSLGAKDYLTKPFTEAQLLARVARLLRAPVPAPPSAHVLVG